MGYKNRIAIIGAGPAGCMAALFAQENSDVTVFDSKDPLTTILCTGGGRCNLAYQEFDFKELAKFYPRGEKFLYSVFSAFSTADTLDFFHKIGVDTYFQEDFRAFPKSNCAKDVRKRMLNAINAEFVKAKVSSIKKTDSGFLVETEHGCYKFDKIIIATGGRGNFDLIRDLGHSVVPLKPALCALVTRENLQPLQGVSLKNVCAEFSSSGKKVQSLSDDILFTHNGISGPLAYKISSYCARDDYNHSTPIVINLRLVRAEFDLQSMFNLNPKKEIKNVLCELIPKSLAEFLLKLLKIEPDTRCCEIRASDRELIFQSLNEFRIHAVSSIKDGEVVTSGGVNLDEIYSKTMESKIVPGVYFCGEVIDVDGMCGGFNLQNCWSTGYIAGKSI